MFRVSPDASPLLDLPALEGLAASGSLGEFLDATAARLSPRDALEQALVRALRLDLALVVKHPEMVLASLYNRTRWLELAPTSGLAEVLDERMARHGRGVARSLRPPPFAWDGPLREEYREELPGGVPTFADDDSAVAVRRQGEPTVGWDRRSGMRLSGAEVARRFAAREAPSWTIDQVDWGKGRLTRGSTSVAFEVVGDADVEPRMDLLAELPDGDVIVAGWQGDYDGLIARLAMPDAKVRWQSEIGGWLRSIAVSGSGLRVAASDGQSVWLVDATTGALVSRLASQSHALALNHDGTLLATLERDRVQVWDVTRLGIATPPWVARTRSGWVDAAWAPDGTRLLTGEVLCDARSGAVITRLDLDGPGYLEGGPPEHGRRLADGRFVEMAPMRGVRVWDTSDGRLILDDSSRRLGNLDEVTISPDGQTYCHWRTRFGGSVDEVVLHRYDDGQRLGAIAVHDPTVARFSRDGASLVLGSQDGHATVCAVADAGVTARIAAHQGSVRDAVFSLDGQQVLTTGADGVIRLWHRTGELLATRAAEGRSLDDTQLARLDGWQGFQAALPPRLLRRRGGLAGSRDRRDDLRPRRGRAHPRVRRAGRRL